MAKFATSITIPEQASPGTPASGLLTIFSKTDGLYYKKDDGLEVGPLGTGGTSSGTASNVVTSAKTTANKLTVDVTAAPPATPAVGDLWVVSDENNATNPYVTLDTAQTITGVKTFSAAPVLPNASVTMSNLSATGVMDGTTYLRGDGVWTTVTAAAPANMVTTDTAQTITATKTFNLAPVVPDGAWSIAKTANLQATLDAKYSSTNPPPAPSNMVTTDTAQTIAGAKTFSASPVVPDASFVISKLSATGTRDATTYLRGDGTWAAVTASAPANMVTTDTAQTITGLKTIANSQNWAPVGTATSLTTFYESERVAFQTSYWDSGLATAGTEEITIWANRLSATSGAVWLESSAEFRAPAVYDNGNRVYSAGNVPPAPSNMVTTDTAQTIAGTKTFSVAPLVPDASFAIAKVTNLTAALDSRVTLGTAQTITASKDFTGGITRDAIPLFPNTEPYPFSSAGSLTVKAGVFKLPIPYSCVVESIQLTLGTAAAGVPVIVDVNRNGITMYTTQANRPTIPDGAVIATAVAPDVTSLVAGDYITVDVDQIGSTTPGADLTVVVRLRRV